MKKHKNNEAQKSIGEMKHKGAYQSGKTQWNNEAQGNRKAHINRVTQGNSKAHKSNKAHRNSEIQGSSKTHRNNEAQENNETLKGIGTTKHKAKQSIEEHRSNEAIRKESGGAKLQLDPLL
jgi:hypothetical protein